MVQSESYGEVSEVRINQISIISKDDVRFQQVSYDDAVEKTGHGFYSLTLLVASAFCVLGAVLDIFAFGTILSEAACDLGMEYWQQKILLTLPFFGAMIMGYFWGYISDRKGRRFSLLAGMWIGFAASSLAAFSPHWIILGILKIIGISSTTCYSSAYTLVGECCGFKVKSIYFFIMTSMIHVSFPVQMSLHYFSLSLNFSYDLGLINFVPWRLLILVLGLPLGISAVCYHLCYESPKLLINAGQKEKANDILRMIWIRNGRKGKNYAVNELVLNEDGNSRDCEVTFLESLKCQILPLFKKPLLTKTLHLYFLTLIIYGSCGGLLIFFPYLANAFISGSMTDQNSTEGLCNMVSQYAAFREDQHESVSCVPKSNLVVVWASLAQGISLTIINCAVSVVASRRKVIMISILLISSLGALGCAALPYNVASLSSYFIIFLAIIGTGIIFSYFVDLYPTSYRGMASCLSMVVARIANVFGINVVSNLLLSHCNSTFYLIASSLFCGLVASCFLPPDKPKKIQ